MQLCLWVNLPFICSLMWPKINCCVLQFWKHQGSNLSKTGYVCSWKGNYACNVPAYMSTTLVLTIFCHFDNRFIPDLQSQGVLFHTWAMFMHFLCFSLSSSAGMSRGIHGDWPLITDLSINIPVLCVKGPLAQWPTKPILCGVVLVLHIGLCLKSKVLLCVSHFKFWSVSWSWLWLLV